MLGLTIRRVSFSNIDKVEVVSFKFLPIGPSFRRDLFISLKWCAYRERVVAIRTRTGLIKRIIVSPGEPEAFASMLTRASARAGAGG